MSGFFSWRKPQVRGPSPAPERPAPGRSVIGASRPRPYHTAVRAFL
jgi:hypothetical protein